MKLPSSLTLPSGARIALRVGPVPAEPRAREAGRPLFSEVLALFDEGIVAVDGGKDVRDLPLADFHVLRAILTKCGLVAEEPIEITCANCDAPIETRPCANLEVGPYVDGELGDPELDVLDETGVPREVAGLGPVTLMPRTVRQAEPLFRAAAQPSLEMTADVASALGIASIGAERDGAAIARILADCDDEAFEEISDLFLATCYPPRLGAIVFCPACHARNDVDAPYERELAPGTLGGGAPRGEIRALPPFEVFAERAHAIAAPLLAELPGQEVELVIEGGTPAVDDGGEPLLGSYVPPYAGDVGSPSRPPIVTVYYKTFCAIEADEGPYDWEAELEETLEHELEHHVYWLEGDDPMDAAERAEIDHEALRVIGRREAARRTARSFGASLGEFARRTWPLWVIALAVAVLTLLQSAQ